MLIARNLKGIRPGSGRGACRAWARCTWSSSIRRLGGRRGHSQKRTEKVKRDMYTSSGKSLAYLSHVSFIEAVQVGQLSKQGDRPNKQGALKSMADVLEVRMP